MTKLTYEGRRVIVAGGGGAGMGAAAARLARELGAEVTVLDLRPPADASGISFLATDLSDPDQIGRAVEKVGGPVHALFNCQGISGSAPGTSSELVMRVNFLGLRHLSETPKPGRLRLGRASTTVTSAWRLSPAITGAVSRSSSSPSRARPWWVWPGQRVEALREDQRQEPGSGPPLEEALLPREVGVDEELLEDAGEGHEGDDVRLRDGPSHGPRDLADLEVVEPPLPVRQSRRPRAD